MTKAAFQVLSLDDFGLRTREYKKRRPHRKTKSGCSACKARRVKCDEARPICSGCESTGRWCDLAGSVTACTAPSSTTVLSANFPFQPSRAPRNGTSTVNLLHHVCTNWSTIFQIPASNDILSLSQSSPLLCNTILAISACHLRHASSDLEHRISEHFHQSLAIQAFQKSLDTPREQLGQSGADALMLSAMLLNMIAFALPASNTTAIELESSWVYNLEADRLGWLALQTGLRPLILSIPLYLENTMAFLGPIFLGKERTEWPMNQMNDIQGIPKIWSNVFELVDFSTCTNKLKTVEKVFRPPITVLSRLRAAKSELRSVFQHILFLSKLSPQFRSLLFDRDVRAMWIFGYWLGLLCHYNGAWWCEKRAKRDYEAICLWLRQSCIKPSTADEEQWQEMLEDLESLLPRHQLESHLIV